MLATLHQHPMALDADDGRLIDAAGASGSKQHTLVDGAVFGRDDAGNLAGAGNLHVPDDAAGDCRHDHLAFALAAKKIAAILPSDPGRLDDHMVNDLSGDGGHVLVDCP